MAYSVIAVALLNNNVIYPFALPSILDCDICEDSHVALVFELTVDKQRLIDFLLTQVPFLPNENLISNSTLQSPCPWIPSIH